jgi:hypothetical protein
MEPQSVVVAPDGLDEADRAELRRVVALMLAQRRSLVRPIGWLGRRVHAAGRILSVFETGLRRSASGGVLEAALQAAYSAGTLGLDASEAHPARQRLGLALATVSGSASGFVGAVGIAADLPVTTTLIMRSIATVARAHGEDITSEPTRRACLEVFALGSPDAEDDDIDVAYWATRAAFSHASITLVIRQVAQRLGLVLAQKYLTTLVPVLGAATGGTLNFLFMQHYQRMAEVHFTIRALERRRDPAAVRTCFEALVAAARAG